MSDAIRIVRVQIEESPSGLLVATSRDLPGMVVAHREFQRIVDDLPAVIKLIFKRRHGLDMEVHLDSFVTGVAGKRLTYKQLIH